LDVKFDATKFNGNTALAEAAMNDAINSAFSKAANLLTEQTATAKAGTNSATNDHMKTDAASNTSSVSTPIAP
jgi:hypothetical protein